MHTREKLYIGGEHIAPEGSALIDVRSPATGELVGRVPDGTTGDIGSSVATRVMHSSAGRGDQ